MKKRAPVNGFLIAVPFWGICIFLILYAVSASYYPGGSQTDKTATAFSWFNNYWCDLLSEEARNGQMNKARPVAVASWMILCFSLGVFWYFLPSLFSIDTRWKKTVRVSGITAMIIAAFLFTPLHDVVIQAGGFLGLVAFTGTLTGLYKTNLYGFFYTGLFCTALMGLNYYIMMANRFTYYLPFIQKITFIIVLSWVILIHREVFLQTREPDR